MAKNNLLFSTSVIGFMLGIFYTGAFFISELYIVIVACIGFGFLYVYILKRVHLGFLLVGLFLILFSLGSLRIMYAENYVDALDQYVGKDIVIDGIVKSEVGQSTYYKNFYIQRNKVDGQDIRSGLRILVRTSNDAGFLIGDDVVVSGVLEIPEDFETETGTVFDYRNYLKSKRVGFLMNKAHVEKTGEYDGGVIRGLVLFKKSFISNIESVFHFPESALLSGLLVGSKQSLGDQNLELFRRAGVSHIIVLSGFNVAIVAIMIMALCRPLPRTVGFVLSIISVVLFALMVGGDATVVRATIMVLVALVGKHIGRNYNALRALIIACFGMLLFNPYILVHDISFELSFMATLALIIIVPVIEPYLLWVPKKFGIREITVSTIAVEVLVMPLILYRMGSVSVVSLFSNLLILPVIAPTMLFGFLSALATYVFVPAGVAVGFVAFLLLRYEMFVVSFMAHFKYALVEVGHFSFFVTTGIYVAICAVLGVLYWRKEAKDEVLK